MSFEKAYESYLEYAKKRHKKQGFYTISNNFNIHILPYFKGRDVAKITKQDVISWQNHILDSHFSNNFNRNLYYELSAFFTFCLKCGYVSNNVVLLTDKFPKKIEVDRYDYYTLREFRKFRRGLDNFIYKQFFNFMFFCGTRPGEAMALRFSDFRKRYVYIRHNISRYGKRELDTPKNLSSVRIIKISLLMSFRLFLLKRKYCRLYGKGLDYFIFGGLKPLSPTNIDRVKLRACNCVHIRPITQHQFRHSYATRRIHKKDPIDEVSKNMGHSTVSMTVDVYLHTKHQKKSIELLFS